MSLLPHGHTFTTFCLPILQILFSRYCTHTYERYHSPFSVPAPWVTTFSLPFFFRIPFLHTCRHSPWSGTNQISIFVHWSCGKWLFKVWTCTLHSVPSYPNRGGRKVTWASIRAAAPMIMAVQFSGVKLSFTMARGFLVASSTIFLLLEYHTPTIRNSVIL